MKQIDRLQKSSENQTTIFKQTDPTYLNSSIKLYSWVQIILGFIAVFSIFLLISILINKNLTGISNRIWGMVIRLFLAYVCWLYATKVLHLTISFHINDLKSGMLITSPIWLVSVYFLIRSLTFMLPSMSGYEILAQCLVWLLFSITIGVFEEFLCRGLLYNGILKLLNGSKHQFLLSILISSAIFAILHLVNYFDGTQTLIVTLTQIFAAMGGGIIFSCTYSKSGSIWLCVLAHAVLDFTFYMSLAI